MVVKVVVLVYTCDGSIHTCDGSTHTPVLETLPVPQRSNNTLTPTYHTQNDVLTSNCQRASTIVHQLLTMCNNTQAPPVYGRAALLLMLVLPLRVQAPLVGTHADMLVQWHASTKQVWCMGG